MIPLHPSLTPAIVDSFAKPSSAARRRFVAADGVTRAYSGMPLGERHELDAEIAARLQAGDVPRAGYYQETVDYRLTNLGVDHRAATLTLSRPLPLPILRTWATQRLVPIVLRIRETAPEQLRVNLSGFDVSSFPSSQRSAVKRIAALLVIARYATPPTAVPLTKPLRQMLFPLRSQFTMQEVALCRACGVEDRSRCGSCRESELRPPSTPDDVLWECAQCRAPTGRECAAGHLYAPTTEASVMARPHPSFATRVMAIAAVEPPFAESESFVIWEGTLRLARRNPSPGVSLIFGEGSRNAVNVNSDGAIALITASEEERISGGER